MKIAKRIITIVLAISIFTSFCVYGVSALTEVGFMGVFPTDSIEAYFTQNPAKVFFSDGVSFASVRFTDSGEFDNTTDLRATTQAYNPNRNASPAIDTTLYIYAQVDVYFNNGSSASTNYEEILENNPWGRAIANGNDVMLDNAYVTDFDSFHFARVYEYYPEESGEDGIEEYIYCIGDEIIYIQYNG